MNPRKLPLICDVPDVTVALCRTSWVERVPASTWSSRVMMSMFCGVLKLFRRIREPVMTMLPVLAGWPCAFVGALEGGVASPSWVFCGVVSAGAAGTACAKAGEAINAVSEIVERIIAFAERMAKQTPQFG
jgi:hypothetical protein